MKCWARRWRKTGTQAEFITESFLDETEHWLRLKDENLARWRELCISGTWKVSGVPQGTQFLRKEGTGRVRSFLKGLREVKGLAGQSPFVLQDSQSWLLLPLDPVQATGSWWEPGLPGHGQVRGQWADILLRWACLFLSLFTRISFSRAGAGKEGISPQAFPSFPSCRIWGISPKPHLLWVGEVITWRSYLPAHVFAFIIGGGVPKSYTFPTPK